MRAIGFLSLVSNDSMVEIIRMLPKEYGDECKIPIYEGTARGGACRVYNDEVIYKWDVIYCTALPSGKHYPELVLYVRQERGHYDG